jgi:hypothetical protein
LETVDFWPLGKGLTLVNSLKEGRRDQNWGRLSAYGLKHETAVLFGYQQTVNSLSW